MTRYKTCTHNIHDLRLTWTDERLEDRRVSVSDCDTYDYFEELMKVLLSYAAHPAHQWCLYISHVWWCLLIYVTWFVSGYDKLPTCGSVLSFGGDIMKTCHEWLDWELVETVEHLDQGCILMWWIWHDLEDEGLIVLSMKGWNSHAGVRRLPSVGGRGNPFWQAYLWYFVYGQEAWRTKCLAWPGQSSSFWSRVLCSRQYLHLWESVGSLGFPLRQEIVFPGGGGVVSIFYFFGVPVFLHRLLLEGATGHWQPQDWALTDRITETMWWFQRCLDMYPVFGGFLWVAFSFWL